MCGVIGAIVAPDDNVRARIDAGLDKLSHRGPNHQEYQRSSVAGRMVWLGHTRLSVIDLTDSANQPMCSEDGRYVLLFNGEIYNYIELRDELCAAGATFHTTSDTEVLLKAWSIWGKNCLDRLDGMFAITILDKEDATLTCVRDPFGIKPFFYSIQNNNIYFASEVPAILELLPSRPAPDLQRAYDYLVHGDYDSSERTFLEGVHRLMPGHIMAFDVASGAVKFTRRWWTPKVEQTARLSFKEAAEEVREQFLQNIRRQLRSDVPLGAALSGGIDSSAIVCAIHHLEPELPIHTFSFMASDPEISEEHWVNLVNQHVGAISHKVHASAEDLAKDIDDMIFAQGEPFGSTSIYAQYRVFKLAKESGITVTLDGQGADELLAGYNGYPGYRLLSLLSKGRLAAAFCFAKAWRSWPGRSYKMIALDFARSLLPDALYAGVRLFAGRNFEPSWLNADMLKEAGVRFTELRQKDGAAPRGRNLTHRLGTLLKYRGLPSLLRHGDRNAMRFSIESRVPFLSTGLCDLLYSLPEEYLVSPAGETKSIFREAMRGIVPDEILDRRDKIGFATPEHAWLSEIAPKVHNWLAEAEQIPFMDTEKVVNLFDEMMAGQRPFNWQIWRLVNYARWWTILCKA